MHFVFDHPRFRGAAVARWLVIATTAIAAITTRLAEAAESADPSVHVSVELTRRLLTIHKGDSVALTFPVAIGSAKHPTPTGTFSIRRIDWNPAWVPPPDQVWARGKQPQAPGASENPMKVVKMYFKEPDYYIHGTNDPASIGEAASHGCLRMAPDDAYAVARYVMEHGGAPRPESWFWRVLHFRRETSTVYLDRPIPLAITQ